MDAIWRFRASILTLVGVLAVHKGRYLVGTPESAHELAAAHSYLTWLVPVVGVLSFLLVVQLAAQLGRSDGTVPALPRGRTLWLAATVTLLGVFGAQETLEAVLAHGHLPEVGHVAGDGGWSAIPLALAVGGVIALLLRGAAAVAGWACGRARPRVRPVPTAALALPALVLAARRSVLARRLAGRGPPVCP